jgi:uncharacterized protein YidB (DUF937 family)
MSLLDTLAQGALGALGGNQENAVTEQLTSALSEGDTLSKVVGALNGGGLASAAASWVGTGANQAAPQSSILAVIQSTGMIDKLAAKTGLPAAILGPIVAQVLPTVIDKLTPDGKLPVQ